MQSDATVSVAVELQIEVDLIPAFLGERNDAVDEICLLRTPSFLYENVEFVQHIANLTAIEHRIAVPIDVSQATRTLIIPRGKKAMEEILWIADGINPRTVLIFKPYCQTHWNSPGSKEGHTW